MQADPGVVHQKIETLALEVAVQDLRDFAGEGAEAFTPGNVQLQHHGATAQAFDLGHQCLGLIGATVVGADDVDALGDQMQGCVFAEAAAGAGDQCDFTVHGTSSGAVGG
ncbi:hypothetical protein D9M73_201570 [compost metagenome]